MNNICNNPYLKINSNILQKIFLTGPTEIPFYDQLGNIYSQKDGVSMGSVLGPINIATLQPINKNPAKFTTIKN